MNAEITKILEEREIEKKLYNISRNCKTTEEYKEALIKCNIRFVEISFGNCTIVIPEVKYNKMKKTEINKLFKYLKGK